MSYRGCYVLLLVGMSCRINFFNPYLYPLLVLGFTNLWGGNEVSQSPSSPVTIPGPKFPVVLLACSRGPMRYKSLCRHKQVSLTAVTNCFISPTFCFLEPFYLCSVLPGFGPVNQRLLTLHRANRNKDFVRLLLGQGNKSLCHKVQLSLS